MYISGRKGNGATVLRRGGKEIRIVITVGKEARNGVSTPAQKKREGLDRGNAEERRRAVAFHRKGGIPARIAEKRKNAFLTAREREKKDLLERAGRKGAGRQSTSREQGEKEGYFHFNEAGEGGKRRSPPLIS